MGVFINGMGSISPQGVGPLRDSISSSWDSISGLHTEPGVSRRLKRDSISSWKDSIPIEYNARMIQCPEPDVDTGLSDKYLRRMSRIIRLGWTSAKLCLEDAGGLPPDAIITGSGWGSVQDSEKFLLSIYRNKENLLPPTPFIQSTHNAVGAQIAMLLENYDYNMSYAHVNFAFEHALLDSMMRIRDGSSKKILCGGFDEITQNQFTLIGRLGRWREEAVSNLELLDPVKKGTIAGEGYQFFFLQSEKNERTYAELKGVETIYTSDLKHIAADSQILANEIDWIFVGLNGDEANERVYKDFIRERWPDGVNVAAWKHLTGEYLAASAFGMWAAARAIHEQAVPGVMKIKEERPVKSIRNILIYNHYKGKYHSFALLSQAE